MARVHQALDELQLRRWLAKGEPVAKSDGDGLTFTLSDTRAATWILRYSRGQRRRELTLGTYPNLTLSDARKKARAYRTKIDAGEDPAADKRVQKARVREAMTVSKLCDDYVDKRFPQLAANSVKMYTWLLDATLRPKLGALEVQATRSSDIVYMLETCGHPFSVCKTLLGLVRRIFKHAAGRRMVDSNPATGVDLEAILGAPPARRKRVMLTEEELRTLLPDCDTLLGRTNGLMFRILLATCVRTSELVKAEKELIDLDRGAWRVRGSTVKTKTGFLVPLPPLVVTWMRELIALSGDSHWLCPARWEKLDGHVNTHILRDAIARAFEDKGLEIRRFTPHDTRSTAKGHLRNLGFSKEISEIALNHKLPGIEGIYDVREEIPERRAAMEAWARFIAGCCDSTDPHGKHEAPATSNVVQLRPRRAA
ncbi:tyrosine-type recombinase/integrase [Paraburkholderia sp. J10-1]|uniref:tyrosine-type recombinase/integrase n=1 Tax=Paraburkholderia sp. J10-1 TaxID=2805430 RepID=UPI002AB6C012|nr:integrase arm-type DNA-binding domain-containing protein [Paraburkholderia sp. J10-1]